jgi:hypothetical protein
MGNLARRLHAAEAGLHLREKPSKGLLVRLASVHFQDPLGQGSHLAAYFREAARGARAKSGPVITLVEGDCGLAGLQEHHPDGLLRLTALRRHRKAQQERRLLAGGGWQPGDYVVDRGDGSPWAPPVFSKGWERFARSHGFEGITFHGLRHGAATLMLAAGVPDPVAVRMMGHADTRILRRYQDVVPGLLQDAAVRLDSLLGPGVRAE